MEQYYCFASCHTNLVLVWAGVSVMFKKIMLKAVFTRTLTFAFVVGFVLSFVCDLLTNISNINLVAPKVTYKNPYPLQKVAVYGIINISNC